METFLFSCMDINLFDSSRIRQQLLPFTYTRPVGKSVGILRWAEMGETGFKVGFETQDTSQPKYPSLEAGLRVEASAMPTVNLVKIFKPWQQVTDCGLMKHSLLAMKKVTNKFEDDLSFIEYTWDIFRLNRSQIISDFDLITKGENLNHSMISIP